MTNHSPQQSYSPQMQQMGPQGAAMRVRRTSSGLAQPPYPPPPGEPVQNQPQQQLKPKRKRATSGQLRVLNSVFASTFFPSTELRIALGKELNMSPRTVQIWFQNKRQSWRANKTKGEHSQSNSGTPVSTSGTFSAGATTAHPLRQEHFPATSSPGGPTRMPSATDENAREEGMENDETGGWEALRQAQASRDYRGGPGHEQNEIGFEEGGLNNSPHHRHR
jgi:Homeodomain